MIMHALKLFLPILVLAGCASIESAPPPNRTEIYNAAVIAAAVPPAEGASVELLQVPGGTVQVVSWSAARYYPLGPDPLTLTRNVWVTVVPQLQEICRALPNGGTTARMEELLGLPPGSGNTRTMIVMEATASDMFRPCADPRLDQRRCTLSVPARPGGYPVETWAGDLAFTFYQASTSYVQTGGYPFMRLGYTYDWNADPPTHVGPSEFLVREGADVLVIKHIGVAEYCAGPAG